MRLAYLFALRPPFDGVYWELSGSLLHHAAIAVDGVPATDFEPLYPIFLAGTRLVSGDHQLASQILQILFASMGAIYTYRLAAVLSESKHVAVIAGALFSFHPLLVRHASAASDLAVVTTLVAAFGYYAVSACSVAHMAVAGGVLGLMLLTRTATLPVLVLGTAVVVAQRRFREGAALFAAATIMWVPWVLVNHSVNGVLWPTRSGVNLFVGNSPQSRALLPNHDPDLLQTESDLVVERELSQLHSGSPAFNLAADQLLMKRTMESMAERPFDTVKFAIVKGLLFFSPRLVPWYVAGPTTRIVTDTAGDVQVLDAERRPVIELLAYSAFYTPILFAAIAGVYLRRDHWRQESILWSVVVSFVIVHALYFPATRYRAPVEFVLLFYAAVSFEFAHRLWKTRFPRSQPA